MILKGSQRAGGRQLAAHLLKTTENEHVEVHELRGFMADDLHSAFNEIYAVSKGTRAQQPFFSLSLSPPSSERVSIDTFEAAIEQAEHKLGLDGQPRPFQVEGGIPQGFRKSGKIAETRTRPES